ncbi:MAG TPA: methionyl-tRNA formyltransferase [Thermomicrobiales bacterium]|nr:methionyl-tRNA formyltransferase [Thermomicrobiales bacterium]
MAGGSAEPPRGQPARVVFLGTPDFAIPILRALVASPLVAVALVVTQPDRPAGRGRRLTPPPVQAAATAAGLDVYQPERLRGVAALDRLAAAAADLFVIAAYGQLLRPAVLALPPRGCLNVHPSLLPRHRGPAPVAAAILAGDRETGVTIMLTDAGMDTGPILAQRRLPLTGRETTAGLTPALFDLGADLLIETIPAWLGGALTPTPQDESRATVSRLFAREDGRVDWRRPASEIARRVRALNPWPRAYTYFAGARLLLLDAREGDAGTPAAEVDPGTVVGATAEGFLVRAGEGAVLVTEVQAAGRRPVAAREFARANPALRGAILRSEPSPRAAEPEMGETA